MIKSESIGLGEVSGNDAKVSKHPDLEANGGCGAGNLLIVSAGTGPLSSGVSGAGFSGLSFRLNANLGLAPAEDWTVCSFSRPCSHDLSCYNAKCVINHHVNGIERDPYRFVLSLVVRGEEGASVHELLSQGG